MNYDLKTNIAGFSTFIYYRENALWYQTEAGLVFPVPVSDAGTTQFLPVEKSMLLMRYIRKYIAEATAVQS